MRDDGIAALAIAGRSESYTRAHVAASATRALAPLRVTVRAWSGRFIVGNATGRTLIVDRLADVAPAATRLTGVAATAVRHADVTPTAARLAPNS